MGVVASVTLPVSEIFHTIQGEGPAAGRTAGFVRLMGCNLSCSWCDSAWTWDYTRFDLSGERTEMSAGEIVSRLGYLPGVVVLTGGEPLLHQSKPAWRVLLSALAVPLHLETNGTVLPDSFTLAELDLVVASPKLVNAGPHRRGQRPTLHAGYRELASDPRVHLKFVCESASDVQTAGEMAEAYGFPSAQTWVMPQGTTSGEIARRWPEIVASAAELGINATHRLHVLAWGDERCR